MCKKLICMVSFVFVLVLAGAVQAVPLNPKDGSISDNLSLWLRMPEVNYDPITGVWTDLSGKGNDAKADVTDFVAPTTLSSGGNPNVFSRGFSTVQFVPAVSDLLRATNLNDGQGLSELTIFVVLSVPTPTLYCRTVGFGSKLAAGDAADNFNLTCDVTIRKDNGFVGGATAAYPVNEFIIHVARMNPNSINQWFNADGTLTMVHDVSGSSYTTCTDLFYLGALRETTRSGTFEIAEVVVFNTALTNAQIEGISEWLQANTATLVASNPSPANEATDVPRDTVLSWTVGIYADKHDVYFGTGFNDVNDATTTVDPAGVYMGRQSETTYLDRLEFGQTYYWRIDEVNAPPDFTVFKGHVWSFTMEPYSIAVPGQRITATASSANSADEGPENTINGSGLDADDLHSVELADMWLSDAADANAAWIQYEFDRIHKLHQMLVWNHNSPFEGVLGFGPKDVTIEYSTDGADWATVGTTHEFAQASGTPGYAYNTSIDLGRMAAKYVKITANSHWGSLAQYGLSEVRFLYIPVQARRPSPDSGATDVALDVVLSWIAGREAAVHDVYFSTDEQAVIDGTTPVTTVTETSHGPLALDLDKTYYWRVDEVNDAETPTTWQGDVWNFRTHEYFVVDDFEDYNDYPPDEIFSTWIDGYGIATNGSTAGYPDPDFLAGEHYVETTIVHGGGQLMPLFYENNFKYSEATMTLVSVRDWTEGGVGVLSLWFYGDASNAAERMYVALNGSAVVYHDNPDAALINEWTEWPIDLQEFAAQGVNLANVNTISIGFGDKNNLQAGGSGMVFIDDIRLYRLAEPEPAP